MLHFFLLPSFPIILFNLVKFHNIVEYHIICNENVTFKATFWAKF